MAALNALCALGKHAAPHAESISQYITDETQTVRHAAMKAILSLEGYATEVVWMIRTEMTHADAGVRLTCIETLSRLGLLTSAVPQLAEAVAYDSCAKVRKAAADSLGSLGHIAASAVLQIFGALFDESRKVRGAALAALTALGANASAVVVPHLDKALETGEIDMKESTESEVEPPGKRRRCTDRSSAMNCSLA